MNQIIHGDNVEILKTFPADMIDLTVTSPPYDNIREYDGYSFDFEALAKELYRVTNPGGQLVWVVADQTKEYDESGTSFEQALYFKKQCGFKLNDTMIYQRQSVPGYVPRYVQGFEYMFVFAKGVPRTLNLLKDQPSRAQRQRKTNVRRKYDGHFSTHSLPKNDGTKIRTNIWNYLVGLYHTSSDKFAFEHPAIFPEKLAADHIKSWSNEGDLILDPFCGAGTTLKMAKLLNRHYIGIDISEKYCDLSMKRVQQERL